MGLEIQEIGAFYGVGAAWEIVVKESSDGSHVHNQAGDLLTQRVDQAIVMLTASFARRIQLALCAQELATMRRSPSKLHGHLMYVRH